MISSLWIIFLANLSLPRAVSFTTIKNIEHGDRYRILRQKCSISNMQFLVLALKWLFWNVNVLEEFSVTPEMQIYVIHFVYFIHLRLTLTQGRVLQLFISALRLCHCWFFVFNLKFKKFISFFLNVSDIRVGTRNSELYSKLFKSANCFFELYRSYYKVS